MSSVILCNHRLKRPMGTSLAVDRVEEDSHVVGVRVNALEITVEDVLQVVKVVPRAASGVVVGVPDVHANEPTVPETHSGSDVASLAIENGSKVVGTDTNVGL
jgi:hypothetical protein